MEPVAETVQAGVGPCRVKGWRLIGLAGREGHFARQEQFPGLHLDPPITQALDQHAVITAPRQMQTDYRAMLVAKAWLTNGQQRRGMV